MTNNLPVVIFYFMIAEKLTDPVFWVLAAAAILNITQRRHHKTCPKKRVSTLILAALIFVFYVMVILIAAKEQIGDKFLILAAAIVVAAGFFLREKAFPYKLKCVSCGAKLSYDRVMYHDSNMCADCDPPDEEEEQRKPSFLEKFLKPAEPEPAKEAEEEPVVVPDTVEEVDWDNWKFTEQAVICYIKKNNQLLLINKKKGLGAGKVNAPGGRIEPGEMPAETAVRECQEEVGLTPLNPEYRADLYFIFKNGHSLRGFVFYAEDYEGELIETDEAEPFWADMDRLPFDKMWADDEIWLPKVLAGEQIAGRFIFDDDKMLNGKVEDK